MAEQHPSPSSSKTTPENPSQSRVKSKNLTPFSVPKHVDSAKLFTLRSQNATFLKAAERHFSGLFEQWNTGELAALISDASGIVLSVYGNRAMLSDMASLGLYPGTITSQSSAGNNVVDSVLQEKNLCQLSGKEHLLGCWKKWSWAAVPILLDSEETIGVCAFATVATQSPSWMIPLLNSVSIALRNWVELEENRQNLARIHQTVVSQLDYHVYYVDPSTTVVDDRHPVPISELARSEMREIATSGLTVQEEMLIDNRLYMVDVRRLTDYKGNYKGTLGLFHDITQQKASESQLRDIERVTTLSSLAAGIAHEIRNPLTAAKGFLQLFTERVENTTDRRFLDLTLTELDRINGLVNDFMCLAKPESPSYGEIDLCKLVEDVVHFIQPEAVLHGVAFDVTMPSMTLWIWADANQLKQVLLNILQNALQACVQVNGTVHLSVQNNQSRAIIRVLDTGIGMDKQQLQKLFQPFYTTKASGTGLGLSISRRIIEEHDGTINVESVPGIGTTVTICLDTLPKPLLKE